MEAVGPEVTEVAPGDRVAYAMSRGSYAEYAIVPASMLVKLPDSVDLETAAPGEVRGHREVATPAGRAREADAGRLGLGERVGHGGEARGGLRHAGHCEGGTPAGRQATARRGA